MANKKASEKHPIELQDKIVPVFFFQERRFSRKKHADLIWQGQSG